RPRRDGAAPVRGTPAALLFQAVALSVSAGPGGARGRACVAGLHPRGAARRNAASGVRSVLDTRRYLYTVRYPASTAGRLRRRSRRPGSALTEIQGETVLTLGNLHDLDDVAVWVVPVDRAHERSVELDARREGIDERHAQIRQPLELRFDVGDRDAEVR